LSIFLSGCSPFGNESFIDIFNKPISQLFSQKTSVDIISGASQTFETNPSTPAINYQGTVAFGSSYNQVSTTTNGGYKVYSTIQGPELQ